MYTTYRIVTVVPDEVGGMERWYCFPNANNICPGAVGVLPLVLWTKNVRTLSKHRLYEEDR